MEASSKLARPYALAAFKQAQDENAAAEWSAYLETLHTIVDDATMKGVLSNPKVDNQQAAALILDVAGDKLNQGAKNFVKVLAQYGRLDLLAEVRLQFEEQRAKLEQRTRVEVTSAFELSEADQSQIAEAMARKLGTAVDLEIEVDNSLIGGCIMRAGDLVIDGSVRGRLAKLSNVLR